MAETLTQLVKEKSSQPQPQEKPAETFVRGDDLMAEAQALQSITSEEARYSRLAGESFQLVNAQMEAKPEFAERVASELEKLNSEGAGVDKIYDKYIDLADEIRIDHLKDVEKPEWFSSLEAARSGFVNEYLLDQLPRIQGLVGEKVMGKDYENEVYRSAEQLRLLQKAFPGEFDNNSILAYLAPGPVKALFSSLAKGGSAVYRSGKTLVERAAKDPKVFTQAVNAAKGSGLVSDMAESAVSGATALGGIGFIKGLAGNGVDPVSFDRGIDRALADGAVGLFSGPIVPLAVAGVSKGVSLAAPTVRGFGKRLGKLSDTIAESLESRTGVPATALKAAARGRLHKVRPLQLQKEMGKSLARQLELLNDVDLPEKKLADGLLTQLPETNGKAVIDFVRNVPANADPATKRAYAALQEWGDWAEGLMKEKAGSLEKVPATTMREITERLQKISRKNYGKDVEGLPDLLKEMGAVSREQIIQAAASSGTQAGKKYIQLMEKAAEKRQILSRIEGFLGNTAKKRQENSTQFFRGLFGPNKDVQQQALANLDSKFGTNFLEVARAAHEAAKISPSGSIPLLGKTHGGLGSAVVNSPRAATALIGASDKVSGFISKMTANPEVLARVAGITEKGARNAAESKALANIRVPLQVRAIAKDLYNTLKRDGSASAGGATRIVADSPYFVGLVHYYDVMERKAVQSTLKKVAEKDGSQGLVTTQE